MAIKKPCLYDYDIDIIRSLLERAYQSLYTQEQPRSLHHKYKKYDHHMHKVGTCYTLKPSVGMKNSLLCYDKKQNAYTLFMTTIGEINDAYAYRIAPNPQNNSTLSASILLYNSKIWVTALQQIKHGPVYISDIHKYALQIRIFSDTFLTKAIKGLSNDKQLCICQKNKPSNNTRYSWENTPR